MKQEELLREGDRILTICNACRYCEGFCAVFPAMEKRLEFAKADINYLANLCHNCQECFYACQYAPPHEFAVNVPKALAQIRVASYEQYAWPQWLRRFASAVAWLVVVASVLVPLPRASGGEFYSVIPHDVMIAVFLGISILVALALLAGGIRFWRETGAPKMSGAAARSALRDILNLEYLRSGGTGCTYPAESHSHARRWFHHLTFYGFLLCFASTLVAAGYHYLFALSAPYRYMSVPVVLGSLGGLGLLAGPVGLFWLKLRQDQATANPGQRSLDAEFIALLFLTSFTGLVLLALRDTAHLATLLSLHLGVVAALFITMPYGKFVHGLYRSLALLRYALEKDKI